MRALALLTLACVLVLGGPARTAQTSGRPFTVEDLLSLGESGTAAFSEDGRWLVYETFGPWASAPTYDNDFLVQQAVGQVFVVDLAAGGAARPLLAPQAGAGDTLGALSPSGDKAIVFRLRDRRRELGIVTLASGRVVWTGQHVQPEIWMAQALWRSDDEVIALSRPPEAASTLLGRGWQIQARTTKAWSAAAQGRLSLAWLGGGRYATANPPAPTAQVLAIEARTGRARVLAQGAFSDLSLAPGGQTLALVEDAETILPDAATVLGADPERRRRLVLLDLVAGAMLRPCPDCDLLPFAWRWAPDGGALVAAARRDGERFGQSRYWRFSRAGRVTAPWPDLTVGAPGGRDKLPAAAVAWAGGDPVLLGRRAAEDGRLDWWRMSAAGPVNLTAGAAGARALVLAQDGADVLLSTTAGGLAVTAQGGPGVAIDGAPAPAGAQRAGMVSPVAMLRSARGARLVDAQGRGRDLAPLPGEARVLALSRSGRALIEQRDAQGVRQLVLRDPAGPDRTLATINAHLADVAFATPRPIRHQGLAGEALTSWLYLPPGRADDDLPVIVMPYPGAVYAAPPSGQGPGELKFETNIQLMTAAGYAVVVPSLPLAPGAEPMPDLARAMLLAVDQARLDEPRLSAHRLAVWGQSYGGYGALAAGIQSPRFKAVIASAAVTNLVSRHTALAPAAIATPEVLLQVSGRLAWAETGQGRMGAPSWAAPERYVRNSPALQIDRMNAPVMLIHGDLDTDAGEVEQVFASLYRLGKDVQLLMYRGEQHAIISPDNVRDLYRRAFDFLRETVGASGDDPAARPDSMRPSQ